MYLHKLRVKEVVANRLIKVEWDEPAISIEFLFFSITDQSNYIEIKNYGFELTGNERLAAVMDNTGGFTTVLDGLKALP